jgi:hypothetical protein
MRACDDFRRFFRSIRGRVRRLRALLVAGAAQLASNELDRRLAYVSLEADNLILSAKREFFVSSMLVGARTLSGHRVKAAGQFATERDVVLSIMSVLERRKHVRLAQAATIPRREETKVRSPSDLFQVASQVGLTNLASVQVATSLGLYIFNELKMVRHFYAHRNKETFQIARHTLATVTPLKDHPSQMLISPRNSSPITTANLWLDEIELFYEELLR